MRDRERSPLCGVGISREGRMEVDGMPRRCRERTCPIQMSCLWKRAGSDDPGVERASRGRAPLLA